MKTFSCLLFSALALGFSQNLSAYEVTVEWDTPGSVLIGTGSASAPNLVTLSPEQTNYVYKGDAYTELRIYPAEGYALNSVSLSDNPDARNSIMRNEVYRQQSYYGIGESWDGRIINVETSKVNYDGELSINVVNGADCLEAFLDMTRTDGSGILRYSYGYLQALTLTDSDNKIPFASEYMKNLNIILKKGAMAKSIYKLTRNGEPQTPSGNEYTLLDITPADIIEVQVYDGEVPVREDVTLTIDYPAALDGCVLNLFDKTSSQFLGMDDSYNFTMPADKSFTVLKGSEIQVNFNADYTFTNFKLGSKDVTNDYSELNKRIRFVVDEDVTLSISGEAIKYNDIEFTAYVYNPDGVRLTLENYQGISNPIKDVTDQAGEAITGRIEIPSYTVGDNDNSSSGNSKTVPSVTMTPENTLKFTVKVSERRPLIYVSPVVGYYIQSLWDYTLEAPIGYIDGSELAEGDRVFYVVAQKLERNDQFIVDMSGNNEVSFRPTEFFQRNWDNPSISFAIGDGERTYNYNEEYDNPFVLAPKVSYAGFNVTLNGRSTGITKTESGTYVIDFTKAYATNKYPIPTLKVTAGSSVVEDIEASEGTSDDEVYNLQGIRLNADWQSLPSGLYIRGGKKCIKK